jgi:hypothetical protein
MMHIVASYVLQHSAEQPAAANVRAMLLLPAGACCCLLQLLLLLSGVTGHAATSVLADIIKNKLNMDMLSWSIHQLPVAAASNTLHDNAAARQPLRHTQP